MKRVQIPLLRVDVIQHNIVRNKSLGLLEAGVERPVKVFGSENFGYMPSKSRE